MERWRRRDATTIEYEVMIEDQAAWSRPWTIKQEMTLQDNLRRIEFTYEPRCPGEISPMKKHAALNANSYRRLRFLKRIDHGYADRPSIRRGIPRATPGAFAQSSLTGAIAGVVKDTTGAVFCRVSRWRRRAPRNRKGPVSRHGRRWRIQDPRPSAGTYRHLPLPGSRRLKRERPRADDRLHPRPSALS